MSIEPKESVARFWDSQQGTCHTVTGFGGGYEFETDCRTHYEWKHLKKIVSLDRNTSLLEIGSGITFSETI